ncbi:hypothetical protein C8Q78DRAFT_339048 [Trametes maxima]|nr:hypothetical protein C8Q78DRAFT_339048 [Trametes maxima]
MNGRGGVVHYEYPPALTAPWGRRGGRTAGERRPPTPPWHASRLAFRIRMWGGSAAGTTRHASRGDPVAVQLPGKSRDLDRVRDGGEAGRRRVRARPCSGRFCRFETAGIAVMILQLLAPCAGGAGGTGPVGDCVPTERGCAQVQIRDGEANVESQTAVPRDAVQVDGVIWPLVDADQVPLHMEPRASVVKVKKKKNWRASEGRSDGRIRAIFGSKAEDERSKQRQEARATRRHRPRIFSAIIQYRNNKRKRTRKVVRHLKYSV